MARAQRWCVARGQLAGGIAVVGQGDDLRESVDSGSRSRQIAPSGRAVWFMVSCIDITIEVGRRVPFA